ncbi:hypothetical protein B0H17DRAFT_1295415, partial [Mycena rosella]
LTRVPRACGAACAAGRAYTRVAGSGHGRCIERRRAQTHDMSTYLRSRADQLGADDIWIDFGFAADPSAATRVASQAPAWTDTIRTANAEADATASLAAPAPAPRASATTTRAMIVAEHAPPHAQELASRSFASFTASANDTTDALRAIIREQTALITRVGALVVEVRAGGGGEGLDRGTAAAEAAGEEAAVQLARAREGSAWALGRKVGEVAVTAVGGSEMETDGGAGARAEEEDKRPPEPRWRVFFER